MKRLLQSLMLCGGLVAAGFLAQAAVTSATAVPASAAVADEAELGTEANPYTVSDICAMKEAIAATKDVIESGVWVEGYIIGNVPTSNFDDAIVGADGASATNLLLSPTPSYRGEAIPVELPKGDVRTALNLQDNPENVGKQVKLYGNIQRYFSQPGFKGVTKYEFVEAAPAEIDYSIFHCAFQDIEDEERDVEAVLEGEGTQYVAKGVELDGLYGFMLADPDMQKMFLSDGSVTVDKDNLSCTLEYLDMSTLDWAMGMPANIEPVPVELTGVYDVKVSYDGETANVTFVPAGETPAIDYANCVLLFIPTNEEEDSFPAMLEGEGNEYKAEGVELNGVYEFVIGDMAAQMRKCFIGEAVITDQNLSCTLNYVDLDELAEIDEDANPDIPMLNLSGTYDVTVVYNGTEATVTFEKVGGPAINYADYTLILQDENWDMVPVALEGEGNEFKAEGVKITSAYNGFLLADISTGEMTTAFVGEVAISDANLSGTLVYYNPSVDFNDPGWPTLELDGTYNVTVVYDGTNANITFEAAPAEEIDYAEFSLLISADEDVMVALETEGGNIYTAKNIKFDGNGMFALVKNEKVYFDCKGTEIITPDNLSCKLYYQNLTNEIDPGFRFINFGVYEKLEGTYDITVVYDGTEATVTFVAVTSEPVDINYADYNLVLFDNEDDTIAIDLEGEGDEFKAENVEFNGSYFFMLADTTRENIFEGKGSVSIDEENLTCTLVYKSMNEGTDPSFGAPNLGQLDLTGTYNVYVVYEGSEAVVTFEKQQAAEVSDYAIQLTSGYVYGDVTEDGSIVYKNVKFEGETDFAIIDFLSYEHYYGAWDIEINDENLSVVIPEDFDWTPAWANLTGFYDVTAKFKEDMSEVAVTLVKVGELTTTVNVAIEGGSSFSYNASNFSDSEFTVAVADSNWSLVAYTYNGEEESIEPVAKYTHEFEAGNENNFIFVAEYNGVCKVIEGSVDVAEFEESAIVIKRVNGNIEIDNLNLGDPITVYTIGGQVISNFTAKDKTMTIELGAGQYVVRAGNVAAKVIL